MVRPSRMLLAVCLTLPPVAGAQSSDQADLDARINKAVVATIREGVELFNQKKDAPGCYRLYQGSLTSLAAFLDERPEQKRAVEAGLALAASRATATDAAFALRDVLNALYEETKSNKPAEDKSLWDRLGGRPAVEAVVADFVAMAAADPQVNFFRDGRFPLDEAGVAHLKQMLVEQISSVSGGPLKYTGRDMKEVHEGMKITEAEFNALAGDLVAVLNKYKVPKAEIDELVGIIATTKPAIVEAP